jgi:O-acetyl-ADP-ribose deacetylase (regulator of RNase III)
MADIKIIQGSILDFEGDAIVNPANSFLRHDGGLARVIAEAADPYASLLLGRRVLLPREAVDAGGLFAEEQLRHRLIPTGACGWTSAGVLPYKGIIHAVGPIWGGGTVCESTLLNFVHVNALKLADAQGCKSVAFPAISCGIFGFPVELAAAEALNATKFGSELWGIDVSFYLMSREHHDAFTAEAKVQL